MGKLTDEQAKALADLQALADAPDDDDYEIVMRNEKGAETRLPSKKAAGWVKEHFGIDLHPAPAPSDGGDQGDGGDGSTKDKQPTKGYFGKRAGA